MTVSEPQDRDDQDRQAAPWPRPRLDRHRFELKGQDIAGRARMAAARNTAGVELDPVDMEALAAVDRGAA